MKKALLVIFILTGSTILSFGQNLVLSNYNLVVSDPSNTNTLSSICRLDNSGSVPVDIMVERTINNLPVGMYELFCFGAFCNPPGTAITSYTTPISAGGRESTFEAKVTPNGNCGTASIHYRFYDQNNPADSTGFTLDFAFCTQGLNDNAESFGLSKPLKNIRWRWRTGSQIRTERSVLTVVRLPSVERIPLVMPAECPSSVPSFLHI